MVSDASHLAAKYNDPRPTYPGAYGSQQNMIGRFEGLYVDLAELRDEQGDVTVNLDTLFVDMLEKFGLVDKWLEYRRGSSTYLPNLYTSVRMIQGLSKE